MQQEEDERLAKEMEIKFKQEGQAEQLAIKLQKEEQRLKAEIEKQKQDATASLDAEVDSLSRQVLEKLLGNLVRS